MLPNRIHIIGSVGSGKTTLARKLSKAMGIPYYELDNVVWKRGPAGDIRRTDQERDAYLNRIVHSERWIIEGAHNHDWVEASFSRAEVIIVLDTPYWKRIYRITRRFLLQKVGAEQAHYKPTLGIFIRMFKWNESFEKKSKPLILTMLGEKQRSSIILRDSREIDRYLG